MGKQINYWLGYEDFLKIAQAALDYGCIIIKKEYITPEYLTLKKTHNYKLTG